MLVIIIMLIVAAVVVYAIRAVKPKRIKFRAGFLKIVTVDFEADAGSQSSESDAIPPGNQPKELPPGRHHRR